MAESCKHFVGSVARSLGLADVPERFSGIDIVLPLIERMRDEGAIVVIKLDGARHPDEGGPYTAVVSGGPLGDDYFHVDAGTVEDALAYVIVNYARATGIFPAQDSAAG